MGDAFWEAFNRSLIIQGIIAMVLLSVISFLYCTGKEVPGELLSIFGVVLGYYFGSKTVNESNRAARIATLEAQKNA